MEFIMNSTDNLFKSNTVINQALLNQIITELKQGNYHRCKAMGISDDILQMIDCLPYDTILELASSQVVWAKVSIDRDVFLRIIHNNQDESKRRVLLDKAIKMYASNKMLANYFGITSNIAALKRKILNVPTLRGRLNKLSEEQHCIVWEEWKAFLECHKDLDNYQKLEKQIELCERYNLNLAVLHQELEDHTLLTKEDKTLLVQLLELKSNNQFIQYFYQISNELLNIKKQLITPIDLRDFIPFEQCSATTQQTVINQWQDLLKRSPVVVKDDLTLMHLKRLIGFSKKYRIQFNSLCAELLTM